MPGLPDIIEPRTLGSIAAAIVTAIGVWLAGQRSGRAEFITAVNTAAGVVIDKLTAECNRVTARCEALERQHASCEAELHEGRVERALLKAQIEQLMRETGVADLQPVLSWPHRQAKKDPEP